MRNERYLALCLFYSQEIHPRWQESIREAELTALDIVREKHLFDHRLAPSKRTMELSSLLQSIESLAWTVSLDQWAPVVAAARHLPNHLYARFVELLQDTVDESIEI